MKADKQSSTVQEEALTNEGRHKQSSTVQEEALTNEGRHKLIHDKRGRITACLCK